MLSSASSEISWKSSGSPLLAMSLCSKRLLPVEIASQDLNDLLTWTSGHVDMGLPHPPLRKVRTRCAGWSLWNSVQISMFHQKFEGALSDTVALLWAIGAWPQQKAFLFGRFLLELSKASCRVGQQNPKIIATVNLPVPSEMYPDMSSRLTRRVDFCTSPPCSTTRDMT